MTTKPSIVITDEDGDALSVWPPIDGLPPAIQIDSGKKSLAVEITSRDTAARLCTAIQEAAANLD